MQTRAPLMVRTGFLWCMLVALLCSAVVMTLAAPAAAEKQVPATSAQSTMSMLPHLEWLLDSSGTLTVDDLSKPQQQAAFRPLKLQDLPREAGTVWLRFSLAGRPAEVRPATLLLDMGDGVPGTPTLFVPKHNLLTGATEWQTFSPSQRTVFLMPETRQEPVTAYIRMDGLPGLWFSPVLRTPHNAATALERLARPAVIVALAVIMLLCLLRGLTERGEWRIWTSLYTAAALVHAVWGVPATSKGHVDMMNVAAVLAPGVGLMILPHVGRHLLRTRQTSRAIDVQLFLLSLPGAALALLPLVPGYSWTTRFLDLWPLGTLLLVPTTLGAWLCGLPGARRFLLGCLLPPIGVAVGILGMGSTIPAPLLGTAPLWGLALGALIIAGTAAPVEHRVAEGPSAGAMSSAQDLVDEDPNLRIVSPEELAGAGEMPQAKATPDDSHALALEESLRGPMDDLLRDGAALAQCALPPVPRQLAENMVQSVHRMATFLAGGPSQSAASRVREEVVFDLQEVLRQAHDAVSAVADSKNIALSWFMPPHLGQRYRGGVAQLDHVLRLLLESAVRATSRGAVQLAVRRVPESVNPGHLLFSVTDSGSGMPPEERSSVALARAWELAGANRGFLGVECSPHGATISFTLHLEAAGVDMTAEAQAEQGLESVPHPGIIVVEDSPGERQLLAFFLEGLGATVVEARSTEEAVDLYMDRPAQLLIFDGDLPPVALHTAVQRVRTFESAEGGTPAMIMGLSSNDAQWEVLRQAGFTHALPKPITRSGLRSTVCQLLPQCAAQESLTPEMDLSQDLPSLPVLGEAEGMGATQAGGFVDSVGSLADDEEVIDTGMPLLEMDTKSVPAATPTPAVAPSVGMPGASPVTPPLSAAAPQSAMPELFSERQAPSGLPDLFPSADELARPAHVPAAHAPAAHVAENSATMQLLPDMGVEMPVADPAAPEGGGLELSPTHETPEVLRAAPVAAKNHAEYLTSLLDGDDDLVRHAPDGKLSMDSEAARLDLAEDAPEAHMAEAVREGAEKARSAEARVDATPVESAPAPASKVSVKVDILARAKEKTPQAPQPPQATEPLHAFDDVPAGTALFVSDAAPLHMQTPSAPDASEVVAVADAPLAEPMAHEAPPVEESALPSAVSQAASIAVVSNLAREHSILSSSADSAEWVGEPQPVGTASSAVVAAEKPVQPDITATAVAKPFSAPVIGSGLARDVAVEWVGEPRPIERPVERSEESIVESAAEPAVEPVMELVEAPVESVVEPFAESPAEAIAVVPEAAPLADIEESASALAVATVAAAADLDVAPAAEVQRDFVPLSMQVEASPLAMQAEDSPLAMNVEASPLAMNVEDSPLSLHAEDSPRPSKEEKSADRARLTLLPQSTPLMDFIIAEPEPAPAPAAVSPATELAATEPASKVRSSVRINITPTKVVKPVIVASTSPVMENAGTDASAATHGAEASAPAAPAAQEVQPLPEEQSSATPEVAQITAPAVTSQPADVATAAESPEPAGTHESAEFMGEEDSVIFTPGSLAGGAGANVSAGTSVDTSAEALAGSPLQPAQPAPAGGPSPTATLRASYGSVGEPMPITKPGSPAAAPSPSKELPLTRLLDYFDQAVQHARQSFEKRDAEGVHEGASYIARQADKVGLRTLARMARCVADAGKAKDMDAVKDLLPELESTVERNRIALGG